MKTSIDGSKDKAEKLKGLSKHAKDCAVRCLAKKSKPNDQKSKNKPRRSKTVANASNVGGLFMKLKLMMGFGQVISFFPVTFDGIAWPKVTIGMMNWLEFFSMPWSVFSTFGFDTCDLQQGFLPYLVRTRWCFCIRSCRRPKVFPFEISIDSGASLHFVPSRTSRFL